MVTINHPIKNNFQNKQQGLLQSEGRLGESRLSWALWSPAGVALFPFPQEVLRQGIGRCSEVEHGGN